MEIAAGARITAVILESLLADSHCRAPNLVGPAVRFGTHDIARRELDPLAFLMRPHTSSWPPVNQVVLPVRTETVAQAPTGHPGNATKQDP